MLDKILECCEAAGENVYFISKDEKLTYQQLKVSIEQLAERLKRIKGVIVLKGHREIQLMILIWACYHAHKCFFIIEDQAPLERQQQMLSQMEVGCIVNCGKREGAFTYEDLLKQPMEGEVFEDELAYLCFTSGTSAAPKGIQIKRENLENFLDWCLRLSPLKGLKHQRIMNYVSLGFDLSLADYFWGFFSASTVIADELDPFVKSICYQYDPTMMVLTPTMAKMLLVDPQFQPAYLPSLQMIFFAGEILEKKTVLKLKERFPALTLVNAYGPSEACCVVSGCVIEDAYLQYETLPIGTMNSNAVQISLSDEKEIILTGESVFKGYLHESGTRKNYATGDLGHIQDDLLFFDGRKDRQIKWKGYRMDLQEIEARLLMMDEIDTAIIQTVREGLVIKAFDALLSVNQVITEAHVKAYLRQYLPAYMIPRRIMIRSSIQLSEHGKKA